MELIFALFALIVAALSTVASLVVVGVTVILPPLFLGLILWASHRRNAAPPPDPPADAPHS